MSKPQCLCLKGVDISKNDSGLSNKMSIYYSRYVLKERLVSSAGITFSRESRCHFALPD